MLETEDQWDQLWIISTVQVANGGEDVKPDATESPQMGKVHKSVFLLFVFFVFLCKYQVNVWDKFKPVNQWALFKSIAACSLVSVLHYCVPTHTFSAPTVLKPFHKIENSKAYHVKIMWVLLHQPTENHCVPHRRWWNRAGTQIMHWCHRIFFPRWAVDVSQCCIIDVVADEGTLYADVCHAWERLVGGGRSSLWNTQMF